MQDSWSPLPTNQGCHYLISQVHRCFWLRSLPRCHQGSLGATVVLTFSNESFTLWKNFTHFFHASCFSLHFPTPTSPLPFDSPTFPLTHSIIKWFELEGTLITISSSQSTPSLTAVGCREMQVHDYMAKKKLLSVFPCRKWDWNTMSHPAASSPALLPQKSKILPSVLPRQSFWCGSYLHQSWGAATALLPAQEHFLPRLIM